MASIAQLVECSVVVRVVAGSSPVVRPTFQDRGGFMEPRIISNKEFQDAIIRAINEKGLTSIDFIENFDISEGSVLRWMNGKSMPHPLARESIITWIDSL